MTVICVYVANNAYVDSEMHHLLNHGNPTEWDRCLEWAPGEQTPALARKALAKVLRAVWTA